ncbi:MAG: DNA repair protein MmcB-related protein [Dehalococcoidia bacterium]|nr:MAG: DNA repair protein MmcB-related protein [Dehalococcoidia bacterium]
MFINHIAYEIKCSRADLFGDRKYPSYWPYCNSFYFAVPNGLVTRAEMEQFAPQCGFIQVTGNGQRMQIVRQPVRMNTAGIEQSIYHHVLMWRVTPIARL